MPSAITTQQYEQVVVNVQRLELKKFKAIVKALGFSIEKKTELQRSIEDVESGRVIKCSSLEELINTVSQRIEDDWLLIWKQNDKKLTLVLTNLGSHEELFSS